MKEIEFLECPCTWQENPKPAAGQKFSPRTLGQDDDSRHVVQAKSFPHAEKTNYNVKL